MGADEVELTNQRTCKDVCLLICVALLGRRIEQVAELCPRGPRGQVIVPEKLLHRKDQIGIRGFWGQSTIGEDLKDERDPVLLQLSRHLDLKELRVRASIGVSLNATMLNGLIVAERTLRDGVELLARGHNVVQEGLGRLRNLDLVQKVVRQSRVPLARDLTAGLHGNLVRGQAQQVLCDVAELRIALLLLEDA